MGSEILVRRGHVSNPGQRQFFGQPILQDTEDALRPALRFWRVGGNQRDPYLLQSAIHLRQPDLVDAPPAAAVCQ